MHGINQTVSVFVKCLASLLLLACLGTPAYAVVADCVLVAGTSVAFVTVIPPEGNSNQTLSVAEDNRWIPIPNWLAGTWQADSEILLDRYDCHQRRRTLDHPVRISIKRQSILGMQKDSNGQIWHYAGVPYVRTIKTKSFIEHQQIHQLSLEYSTPAEVRVTCLATVTRVKRNGEILKVFRELTTTTYSPIENGLIQVNFLINDFDMTGALFSASRNVCVETRVKSFQPIDENESGNLNLKFRAFLLGRGSSSFLPYR